MLSSAVLLVSSSLLLAPAQAEEIVLRNDTNYDDVFQTGSDVIWLEYPECAIAVLTPEPEDYPLEIHTIQFFFVSNTGNLEGASGYTELGIQILDEGAAPTGRGDWAWGEEAFLTTASSEALNELYLEDDENGWNAVTLTEGSLAVWMCPTDPATGADWPFTSNSDVAGVVVDGDSPSTHNYAILADNKIYELSDLGVKGSWIIRAVAGEGEGSGSGGDDGGSGGDDGSGDDGGEGDLAVDSVTPSSIMQGEAATIAIVGEGFEDDASAWVGGLAVSAVSVSGSNALTGTVPSALPAGTHDVMVTNPGGGSATLAGGFTVLSSEDADGSGGGCGCSAGSLPTVLAWLWAPVLGLISARRRRQRSA